MEAQDDLAVLDGHARGVTGIGTDGERGADVLELAIREDHEESAP
jgi:hypothetical protein